MTADDFLAEWRRLLGLEYRAAREQFDALRETLDVAGRVARGLAADGLVVTDTNAGPLGRTAWTLRPKEGELPSFTSAGDPVQVYRWRSPEEAVKGLVTRRTRRELVVAFDEPPDEDLASSELVVEKLFDDTSNARLLDGLSRLASTRGRTAQWLELARGGRPPVVGKALVFKDDSLNAPQLEALSRAMSVEDVALVHGPPGTGKTQVLAAIAAAEIARGGTVLACAASNAAVDNLAARLAGRGLDPVRLGHPARVSPDILPLTMEARVDGHENSEVAARITKEARELIRRADRASKQGRASDRFAEARQARSEAKRLFAEARKLVRVAEDDILARATVVCSTLTGLKPDRFGDRRFTLAIIDEATQATVPATMMALPFADRVVLAGDHHQLPPTVLSQEASRGGLSLTWFERLQQSHGAAIGTMLEVQHRMHREIMQFPNEAIYGGRLRAHPSVEAHLLSELPGVTANDVTGAPLLFVDTAGKGWGEERPPGSQSLRNPDEAARIVREVKALLASGVPASDIGVITPYAAQAQLLRSLLDDDALEVDTVDSFQGREKEAICVSLVRSNDVGELGFCADLRRMNVAWTRARRRLFVVGDSSTLGGHPFYAKLLAYTQDHGAWRSAWEEAE